MLNEFKTNTDLDSCRAKNLLNKYKIEKASMEVIYTVKIDLIN